MSVERGGTIISAVSAIRIRYRPCMEAQPRLGQWKRGALEWLIGLITCMLTIAAGLALLYVGAGMATGQFEMIVGAPWIFLMAGGALTFFCVVCLLPTLPIQAFAIALATHRPVTSRSFLAVIPTCLSAVATAFCYDYLIPNYRLYSDPGPPWVHGLTARRFGTAFGVQAVILTVAIVRPIVARQFKGWRRRRRGVPLAGETSELPR